jgi:uncharacterized membrane-anchored protein YhcB (DUF1043 family)
MFDTNAKQALLLGSANTAGLVSLLAYSLRTFNEINSNLEDIRSELEQIKGTFSENNKRSNMAFNKLNQKIEENSQHLSNNNINLMKKVKKLSSNAGGDQKKKVTYESDSSEVEEIFTSKTKGMMSRADDINSAINELMGV